MSNIKSQLTERQKLQDQLIKLDESSAANAGKELAGIFNDALQVLRAIPVERQNATLMKSPVKEVLVSLGLMLGKAATKPKKSTYDATKPSKTAQETYEWLKSEPQHTQNKKDVMIWANITTPTLQDWFSKEPFKSNLLKPKKVGTSQMLAVK